MPLVVNEVGDDGELLVGGSWGFEIGGLDGEVAVQSHWYLYY